MSWSEETIVASEAAPGWYLSKKGRVLEVCGQTTEAWPTVAGPRADGVPYRLPPFDAKAREAALALGEAVADGVMSVETCYSWLSPDYVLIRWEGDLEFERPLSPLESHLRWEYEAAIDSGRLTRAEPEIETAAPAKGKKQKRRGRGKKQDEAEAPAPAATGVTSVKVKFK